MIDGSNKSFTYFDNIIITMMHSSPETIELTGIFKQLDKEKQGFINKDEFKSYIGKQPKQIPAYIIDELFNLLPEERMDEHAFVLYVMGYRMNLEQLAMSRFAMEKYLSKHVAASPPSGANEVRKSKVKMSVASKKHLDAVEKHKLHLCFGMDSKAQAKRFEEFQKILGSKPHNAVGVIKFKVNGSEEPIRKGLETVIERAKGIVSEMDEEIFRILQLFKFTVKAHEGYIYLFVEVSHVFISNLVTFLNEFIQSLSPESTLTLSGLIQSNYFKDFLKEEAEKKLEDLEVQLELDIDNESLKKVKQIIGGKAQFYSQKQEMVGALFLLFQQVSMELSFSSSQKIFNQMGLGGAVSDSKSTVTSLKDMAIGDTLKGFIPESEELIDYLKAHAKGQGEISINLGNLFVKLEFNVEVEGVLDLL